jgi:CBS domain-containing protein
MVSQEDWLSLQSQYPTQLIQRITDAPNLANLAALRQEANKTIWHNFETKGDAVSLTGIVTVINDAVTRRAISLCLHAMSSEGHGDPPVPFAWIGMGSEGRSAQTITTDQDNGLIYQNVPDKAREATDAWFTIFAEKVVASLESCGFDRCAGNAMATNPDLRGSVDHWNQLFKRIITTADDEDLFEACIYFDFRCLFGKSALANEVKDRLMAEIKARPYFLRHLVETTVQGSRPPVRDFRWRLYAVTGISPPPFDIKKTGLMPLDSAIRVLALLDGIKATATLDRLRLCLENGRMSIRLAEEIRKAFDLLLRLRFKIEFSASGPTPDHTHLLDLNTLPPAQARYLVDALQAVLRLQSFVYEQVVGRKMHWSIS